MRSQIRNACAVDVTDRGDTVIVPHRWEYDANEKEWYCRGCGTISKTKPKGL